MSERPPSESDPEAAVRELSTLARRIPRRGAAASNTRLPETTHDRRAGDRRAGGAEGELRDARSLYAIPANDPHLAAVPDAEPSAEQLGEWARVFLAGSPRTRAARVASLLELTDLSAGACIETLYRRLGGLDQVRDSVSRLRSIETVATMMRRATIELCETCGFDRAMLSRVHGSELVVEGAHAPSDPELVARLLEFGKTNRPRLDYLLIETDMIRRGKPILVRDVDREPRTHGDFVTLLQTRAYVAAPIMPTGRVIGFLHADLADSDRIPDTIDRDRLWAFAEGLGYAIERTILQERLRRQAGVIRNLLRSTEATLDGLSEAEIELTALAGGPLVEAEAQPSSRLPIAAAEMDGFLTTRERQVLRLMVGGATNGQIAEQLVISIGTVKSHVAHVLRKLGASNRADAVSRYLQAKAADANGVDR